MIGEGKSWSDFSRICNAAAVLWLSSMVISMTVNSQVEAIKFPCDLLENCSSDFARLESISWVLRNNDNDNDDERLWDYCHDLQQIIQCLGMLDCRGDLNHKAIKTITKKRFELHNCSYFVTEDSVPDMLRTRPPPPTTTEPFIALPPHYGCTTITHSHDMAYCSIFGDPHVITEKGYFQTCNIAGAYPLVENRFLAIQVAFKPVQRSIHPQTVTSITRVTVIVKKTECSPEQKAYEVQVGSRMPEQFEDGTTESDTVKLVQRIPGSLHEVRIFHLKTIIFIRHIGAYLSVSIRLPKSMMDTEMSAPYQMCSAGCPTRDILSRRRILQGLPLQPLQQAEQWCSSHNLTGPFYEACYFDSALTGDVDTVLVSKEAQLDWQRLAPTMDGVRSAAWAATRYDMLVAQSVRNSGVSEAVNVKVYYFLSFTFPALYLMMVAILIDWMVGGLDD